jgi:putative membrane protein
VSSSGATTCFFSRAPPDDRFRAAVLGVFLLLSGSAFAESLGEKSGVNAALGITPTTADFVKEAAIGNMFEVESSKLAAEKAPGSAKDFANQITRKHLSS